LEGVCVASAIVLYPDQLEVTPPSHEMDEKQVSNSFIFFNVFVYREIAQCC